MNMHFSWFFELWSFGVAEVAIVFLFLRMYNIVNQTTPNIFAISQIGLGFFSLMTASFNCINTSLVCILTVPMNNSQRQIQHLESTPDFLSLIKTAFISNICVKSHSKWSYFLPSSSKDLISCFYAKVDIQMYR